MAESRYKAALNYPNGPKARAEILKDNVAMKKPMFEDLKEAEDYASEMQRETRGKKEGGAIKAKGWGQARSARAAKVY